MEKRGGLSFLEKALSVAKEVEPNSNTSIPELNEANREITPTSYLLAIMILRVGRKARKLRE